MNQTEDRVIPIIIEGEEIIQLENSVEQHQERENFDDLRRPTSIPPNVHVSKLLSMFDVDDYLMLALILEVIIITLLIFFPIKNGGIEIEEVYVPAFPNQNFTSPFYISEGNSEATTRKKSTEIDRKTTKFIQNYVEDPFISENTNKVVEEDTREPGFIDSDNSDKISNRTLYDIIKNYVDTVLNDNREEKTNLIEDFHQIPKDSIENESNEPNTLHKITENNNHLISETEPSNHWRITDDGYFDKLITTEADYFE